MLRSSSVNDSGLTSTGRQPDNDIDGNYLLIFCQFKNAQKIDLDSAETETLGPTKCK